MNKSIRTNTLTEDDVAVLAKHRFDVVVAEYETLEDRTSHGEFTPIRPAILTMANFLDIK